MLEDGKSSVDWTCISIEIKADSAQLSPMLIALSAANGPLKTCDYIPVKSNRSG